MCNSGLIQQIAFGHEHPNKRLPLPEGGGGGGGYRYAWVFKSRYLVSKLPGEERGVKTQLKFSSIIIHSTPLFPLTLEPCMKP